MRIHLTVIIWEEEGVYVSKCPEVEVSSAGDTPQEALLNLKEAVELWIVNAKELGIIDDYYQVLSTQYKFSSSIEMDI